MDEAINKVLKFKAKILCVFFNANSHIDGDHFLNEFSLLFFRQFKHIYLKTLIENENCVRMECVQFFKKLMDMNIHKLERLQSWR
jgi:hypothetical protein